MGKSIIEIEGVSIEVDKRIFDLVHMISSERDSYITAIVNWCENQGDKRLIDFTAADQAMLRMWEQIKRRKQNQ